MFLIKGAIGMNIWTIKKYLGEKLGLDPILLKIEKTYLASRELKDCDNAKTLYELDIKDGDKFKISAKMVSSMIDQMNLLFSDQTLTPEADLMFTEVFNKFTNEDGFMTPETCCKFLQHCTNQVTDINDTRIIRLFDNYCQTEDKIVTCNDFKRFYKDSIVKKATTVWGNIRAWGYKQDLKKGTDRTPRDPYTLLRFLLPRKKEYFLYFVGLLNEKHQIAKDSFELISRLSVDPNLYEKVSSLSNKDENGDEAEFKFEDLVDVNNPFELMYLLSLIYYFIRGGFSQINTVHVVYNENELEEELNEDQLEVKGKSVGVGTSNQTNVNIPPPTPAVPSGKSKPLNSKQGLQTSESGNGKAKNVMSAATKGTVPDAPPLPFGMEAVPPSDFYPKETQIVGEIQELGSDYPPGGEQVDLDYVYIENSDAKQENIKDIVKSSEDKKDEKEFKNYVEFMPAPSRVMGDGFKEMTNEQWVEKFIKIGGFQFLFKMFTSEETFFKKAITDIDTLTTEEKECVRLVLDLLHLIMGTAQLGNDKTFLPSVEIIKNQKQQSRELAKVDEDTEMVDEDAYDIDEAALMKSVGNTVPSRKRTISTIAKEENEKAIEDQKKKYFENMKAKAPNLLNVLIGENGDKILAEFPYKSFIKKSMTIISTILVRRAVSSSDEAILEKLLDMKMMMYLYDHDLIEHLYQFKEGIRLQSYTYDIDIREFLIRGMTFTTFSKIKASFSLFLTILCVIKHTKKARLPLMVILETYKDHFLETVKNSSRYYGYQEFYAIFCKLIHMYFEMEGQRNKQYENVLLPRVFLKQLINILKEYKSKEKRNTVVEDHCLIGTFDVIEQILKDKPEYTNEIALEEGLLHEVFFNCLFQETVEAPKTDLTINFDVNSTDFHANK